MLTRLKGPSQYILITGNYRLKDSIPHYRRRKLNGVKGNVVRGETDRGGWCG